MKRETPCPECAIMAEAQKKLARSNVRLRAQLDIILAAFNQAFSEEDTIDWRENATKG